MKLGPLVSDPFLPMGMEVSLKPAPYNLEPTPMMQPQERESVPS